MIKFNNTNINHVYFSRLPREYQEVEYLKGDGKAYLMFPLDVSKNWTMEFDANFNATKQFGRNIGSEHELLLFWRNDISYYGGSFSLDATQYYNSYHKYLVTYDQPTRTGSIYINGTKVRDATNCYLLDLNPSVGFPLFGIQNSIGNIEYRNNSEYRSFKLTQEGNNINLVPCYRKSDNVAGMYDVESGTFYTNQGTGTFIVGNKSGIKLDHIYYNGTLVYGEYENILLDMNNEELFDKNNEQLIEGD